VKLKINFKHNTCKLYKKTLCSEITHEIINEANDLYFENVCKTFNEFPDKLNGLYDWQIYGHRVALGDDIIGDISRRFYDHSYNFKSIQYPWYPLIINKYAHVPFNDTEQETCSSYNPTVFSPPQYSPCNEFKNDVYDDNYKLKYNVFGIYAMDAKNPADIIISDEAISELVYCMELYALWSAKKNERQYTNYFF
jgi:hypothetical protein